MTSLLCGLESLSLVRHTLFSWGVLHSGPSGDPVLQCSFCELHTRIMTVVFAGPHTLGLTPGWGGGKSLAERFFTGARRALIRVNAPVRLLKGSLAFSTCTKHDGVARGQ